MSESPNRYHLLRHGESIANRRGLIASRPENALESYGLTPRGRATPSPRPSSPVPWSRRAESWGVESIASVLGQAKALLRDLAEEPPSGVIVLCTHGDVASALLCDGLGLPLGRHRDVGALANAELRELPSARRVLDP